MKNILVIFCLSIAIFCQAQNSNFLSITLTTNDGQNQEVYYKSKTYIIDNSGQLKIYSELNEDSLLNITAADFSAMETLEGRIKIISAEVKKLNRDNPVILRQLVEGSHKLYVYVDENGEETYLDESNGVFTILGKNIIDKSEDYFKKWLFENMNPRGYVISYYKNMTYSTEDLADYYYNNQSNTKKFAQEEQVRLFKANLHAGILSNSASGFLIDSGSSTSFKFGIQGIVNLDHVKNRHSILTGVSYLSDISAFGVGNIISQPMNSQLNRLVETDMNLEFLSFHVGYQYNFYINQVSISPFASLGPSFHLSGSAVESVYQDNGEQFFMTKDHITTPYTYNLGLKLILKNKYFLILEYSYLSDIIFQRPLTVGGAGLIDYDLSSFYVGIGYNFL